MVPTVVGVKYLRDYLLEIRFENGETGVADFSAYAKRGGIFSPLAQLEFFKKASCHTELGTVCWPNGADIAPERLYEIVHAQMQA